MNYEGLIEHILQNAYAYLEEYEKKDKLDDVEKGILKGLWYCIDSIENQLEIDLMDTDNEEIAKEIVRIKNKCNLIELIERMQNLSEE